MANKNNFSGNTTMLLLQLLSEKEMYGYEMIETLSARSNNVFELKAGTLYPLLHGLVKSKYLEKFEKDASGKMRVYYRITPSGKNYLAEISEEWSDYVAAVKAVMKGC